MVYILAPHQQRVLAKTGRTRFQCTGNGHCLLYSLFASIKHEHNYSESFAKFVEDISAALVAFIPRILEFDPTLQLTEDELLEQCHQFLFHYNGGLDVVDSIIGCFANLHQLRVQVVAAAGTTFVEPDEDVPQDKIVVILRYRERIGDHDSEHYEVALHSATNVDASTEFCFMSDLGRCPNCYPALNSSRHSSPSVIAATPPPPLLANNVQGRPPPVPSPLHTSSPSPLSPAAQRHNSSVPVLSPIRPSFIAALGTSFDSAPQLSYFNDLAGVITDRAASPTLADDSSTLEDVYFAPTSKRARTEAISGGYRFQTIRRTEDGTAYWRCRDRNCPARLITRADGSSQFNGKSHNHANEICKVKAAKAMSKIRERAIPDAVVPAQRIFEDETAKLQREPDFEEIAAELPLFDSIRKSITKLRRRDLPPLPASVESVEVPERYKKTISGADFLLFHDKANHIIVFATREGLSLLCDEDTIILDGTFRSCPRLFYQIYSLHIFKGGKQFPCGYALLHSKSAATYRVLFNEIKACCTRFNLTLNPSYVISDFESALFEPVRVCFPAATHKACHFHFGQSLFRKVQELGLVVAYNAVNSELRRFVRQCAALAFLPRNEVIPAWNVIRQNVLNLNIANEVNDFCAYFNDTYIAGSLSPDLWNFDGYPGPRTTNAVEGWHSRLNHLVMKSHPNVFEIMDRFQREEAAYHTKFVMAGLGRQLPGRSRKAVRKDDLISRLKLEYANGQKTQLQFLNAVGYQTGL